MPLDQSPPGQSVAGLGDAAAPDRGAARMLRRYEAEIGHQLAGTLAKRYGINQKTVAKWKKRTSVADLSVEEEAVIVAFRRYALLQLDDCLHALQPTISHLTRSSLHHCLQRHGIGRLPDLEGDRPAKKKFKSYPIGFFHIDIAEVRTEQGKLHMFAAIDRTSKFCLRRTARRGHHRRVKGVPAALDRSRPCKIHTVRTDHGIQFTTPGAGGSAVSLIKEAIANGELYGPTRSNSPVQSMTSSIALRSNE